MTGLPRRLSRHRGAYRVRPPADGASGIEAQTRCRKPEKKIMDVARSAKRFRSSVDMGREPPASKSGAPRRSKGLPPEEGGCGEMFNKPIWVGGGPEVELVNWGGGLERGCNAPTQKAPRKCQKPSPTKRGKNCVSRTAKCTEEG